MSGRVRLIPNSFELTNRPVCAGFGGFAPFFAGAATLPWKGGEYSAA
jgi:hypothetical protein